MARLKEQYENFLRPELMKTLGMSNVFKVPKINKIVLNMGIGRAAHDADFLAAAVNDLMKISGQKPKVCRARKSIAGFKLREGMPVGAKVTLRSERMYEFLDRLVNVAMPRIKDFRGISARIFDGRGCCTFGIRDHSIFPEINYDTLKHVLGFDICIDTSAKDNRSAFYLLKSFNFPFVGEPK